MWPYIKPFVVVLLLAVVGVAFAANLKWLPLLAAPLCIIMFPLTVMAYIRNKFRR